MFKNGQSTLLLLHNIQVNAQISITLNGTILYGNYWKFSEADQKTSLQLQLF